VAARLIPERTDSLTAAAAAELRRLAAQAWSADFYLAGSAALALYLGHRPVGDLDLMSGTNRLAPQARRDLLADLLVADPELTVETARDGYLFARAGSGGALRFFYYPYPLVDPEERQALAVASPVDLGLMKLGAIISRASRRDFLDLYLLARQVAVGELLARAEEKFGHVGDFALQAVKALADLESVENEPLPRLNEEVAWSQIEDWARGQAALLGRPLVGIG
jgi:hypothetical protein